MALTYNSKGARLLKAYAKAHPENIVWTEEAPMAAALPICPSCDRGDHICTVTFGAGTICHCLPCVNERISRAYEARWEAIEAERAKPLTPHEQALAEQERIDYERYA